MSEPSPNIHPMLNRNHHNNGKLILDPTADPHHSTLGWPSEIHDPEGHPLSAIYPGNAGRPWPGRPESGW